jgi:periplasmic protein TonB
VVIANETTHLIGRPATARPMSLMAHIGFEPNDKTPLAPVLTFVVWIVCLAIGLLGFLMPYSRPHQPIKTPQSVKVERLIVELSKEPEVALGNEHPPGSPSSSVPLPADAMAPPPIAVAAPSAAIAFAVPVEGPTRVVLFNEATYAKPSSTAAPTVQKLTFGQGEGRQPTPEYPAQAIQQHQEGTVVVRLVVGESGQVSSAEATQPCLWPLLNEAALRAVRQQWRFPPGSLRVYDVAIHFQIAAQ